MNEDVMAKVDVLIGISPALIQSAITSLTAIGNFIIMALVLATTVHRFVSAAKRRKILNEVLKGTPDKKREHA